MFCFLEAVCIEVSRFIAGQLRYILNEKYHITHRIVQGVEFFLWHEYEAEFACGKSETTAGEFRQ